MLDEFRSTNITWDKATSRIYSPVTANASDENGRKLVVQIVNGGQVEDLTGATLHLYWETRDKLHDGLDVFKAVDLEKGEFELSYTTGMLSNQGVLNANLVLIDTVGRVVSERFKITVTEGIDNDAIQSENSFSSLTQALIDISNLEQNYAPRLNDLTAQLQHIEYNKADQSFVDSQLSAIVSGAPKGTFTSLLALRTAYPNGAEGVFLVLENGHWYYYNNTAKDWMDGGVYQSTGIANDSVTESTLSKRIYDKIPFRLNDYTWERGNIYLGNDEVNDRRIRIKNGQYLRLNAGDRIVVGSKYRVLVQLLDNDFNYVSGTVWNTPEYTIQTSGFYRIMVEKTQNTVFTDSELSTLPSVFKLHRISFDSKDYVLPEVIDELRLAPSVKKYINFDIRDLPWELGSIDQGNDAVGTNRMRTVNGYYIFLTEGDIVSAGFGLNIILVGYDKEGRLLTTKHNWQMDKQTAEKTGYYRVVLSNNGSFDLSAEELKNYPQYLRVIKKGATDEASELVRSTVLNQEIKNARVISDMTKEKMAHCVMLYADEFTNDGTIWATYYTSELQVGEGPMMLDIFIKVAKFNLYTNAPVEYYTIIKVGEEVGGFTQLNRAPYDPNIIVFEDKLVVTFNAYIDGKVTIGTLDFNKATKAVSNYQTAQLTYKADGVDHTVDLNVAGIRTAYEAVTPYTLTAQPTDMCMTSNFIKYGDYIYTTITEAFSNTNFPGMIVRSLNGVQWELVTIPTMQYTVVEAAIAIRDNLIYYTYRGFPGNRLATYNMTTDTWSNFIMLPGQYNIKTALINANGKILVAYTGSKEVKSDWGRLDRSNLIVAEIGEDLSVKKLADVQSSSGIHYPCFFTFKGDIFLAYSEDRRKLNNTNQRANIAYLPLAFY